MAGSSPDAIHRQDNDGRVGLASGAMTAHFGDHERAAVADAVGGLLDRRSSSSAVRTFVEDGGFDANLWQELGALGWTGLLVAEEYGGANAGLRAACVVLAGLGRHTTPGPYLSSAVLAAAVLSAAPNEDLRKRWLPGIATGEFVGAVALAGASGRVDADLVPLRLRDRRLDGIAPLVMDGADADVVVVGARTDDGPALVAVGAGWRAQRRPSIDRTRSMADLHFDGVRVDDDAIVAVGTDAERLIDHVIDVGVVALAADAMGAANRAFDMALDYARQREQFGRPIGSFQAIKHKLADMYILAKGAEAAIDGAAASIDRGDGSARRRAAVAGSYCRSAAAKIAGEAVQIHGGIGFTWEHDCHLLLKRTKCDLILMSDTWTQGERLISSVVAASREQRLVNMPLAGTGFDGEDGELTAFRHAVQTWLDGNAPQEWQSWFESASTDEKAAFLAEHSAKLRAAGYLAPHWPKEFGGGGCSAAEQLILKQELRRAGYPPAGAGIGFHHVAATLIRHGTAEQQRALGRILDGEVWCQGFSEPNAGSDLASLQTRAERDGDVYVVNGQKVWSSGAQIADWCLLLARTDPTAKKHKGISVFMLDMNLPGVEVRPIRQATGDSHFSEIFLSDVRVAAECRIGPENGGWAIANTTLATERGSMIIDNHAQLERMLHALCRAAAHTPLPGGVAAVDHGGIRHELAERAAEVEVLGVLAERVVGLTLRHGEMGPEGSIIKLFFSEALQKLTELAMRLRGVSANLEPERAEDRTGSIVEHVGSWVWTISAGSNEIQRNIIAERVLGLPREPSFN